MQHNMLLSKLNRVTVTAAYLNDERSCGIDEDLLISAKMQELQKIELCTINNGERFSDYIIKAQRCSGVISLNGSVAIRARDGNYLVVCNDGSLIMAGSRVTNPLLCKRERIITSKKSRPIKTKTVTISVTSQ
jgi:aspartate 1-decarboxylase